MMFIYGLHDEDEHELYGTAIWIVFMENGMDSSQHIKSLKAYIHKEKEKERQRNRKRILWVIGSLECFCQACKYRPHTRQCCTENRSMGTAPACIVPQRSPPLQASITSAHNGPGLSQSLLAVFKSHHTISTNADGHEYQCPDQRVRVLTRSGAIHSVCTLKAHLKDLRQTFPTASMLALLRSGRMFFPKDFFLFYFADCMIHSCSLFRTLWDRRIFIS